MEFLKTALKTANPKKVIIEKLIATAIIMVVVLTFDLTTKYLIEAKQDYKASIIGIFNITYLQNPGIAFGNLADSNVGVTYVVQIFVTLAALTAALFFKQKKYWIFCIIIAFAGLSNIINRVISGYVIDMIQFKFWSSFPIFNVADIFIVISSFALVIILLIEIFKSETKFEKEKRK